MSRDSTASSHAQKWLVCTLLISEVYRNSRNSDSAARAVRPWHPWRGHSLLQGCPGRREGVFRVLAGVSGSVVSASPGWAGAAGR